MHAVVTAIYLHKKCSRPTAVIYMILAPHMSSICGSCYSCQDDASSRQLRSRPSLDICCLRHVTQP